MKKKILCFAIPVLGFTTIATIGANNSFRAANASITEKTVIFDSFNDSQYKGSINTNIWEKPNASTNNISQSAQGFTYLTQSGASKGVEFYALSTREKLSGIKSVQFDVWFGERVSDNSKWFSSYFVTEQDIALKSSEKNGLAYDGVTRMTFNQITNCGGASTFNNGESYLNIEPTLGVAAYKTWYTFRYDIVSATRGKFNISLSGTDFNDANAVEFTYDHIGASLTNAYFVLAASNEADEIRFDNIKIENDTRTINENFDECDLEDSDCPFEIIHNEYKPLKDTTYKVIDNCTLEFNNAAAGNYIYSKTSIKDLTNGIKDLDILDLSFKVKMINKNDKLGVVFGYNPSNEGSFKNCVVFEITKNNGLLTEYDEEGNKITSDETNKCSFTSIGSEAVINISFNANKGVSITENGSSARYNGSDVSFSKVTKYLGRIGLVALNRATSESEFYIDQLTAKCNSYYKPITKSVSHGFNYAYWGPEDAPDFYVKQTPEGCLSCENGRLVFKGASDNTFFGSAHQYDDFILDYKIMNIYGDPSITDTNSITGLGRWLGLDLARSKVDYSTYGSYCTAAFKIVNEESSEIAGTFLYADDNHRNQEYFSQIKTTVFKNVPASLFRDITYSDISMKKNVSNDDAVCVRYVSEGGKLSLFMKKASELNFTKYITYSNLDLNGYYAIACTGYTFLEMDDFTMTNTSEIYENADTYEPEPNVIHETEIIYDNQNKEENLNEEIKLNSGCGGSIVSGSIIIGFISLVAVIALVVRKKELCEK